MRLLVSGCTSSTKRLMAVRPDRLGVLLTPSNGNREWWGAGCVWACDNDCFRGLDGPAYLRMVARVLRFRTRPAWVACPDVVAGADETRRRFGVWRPLLAELGLSAAYVAQDGETAAGVPWGEASALFIGGSTAWKESVAAARLAAEAHARGLSVHWGRVNTLRRLSLIARDMLAGGGWCDTFDGTGFSAYGDKRIPLAIRWIDRVLADRQPDLFSAVTEDSGGG